MIFAVTYACTVKTIDNETYVSSPGYPKRMHELGSCEVNIQKSSSEIRQIRIDFIDFNMVSAVHFVIVIDEILVVGVGSRWHT